MLCCVIILTVMYTVAYLHQMIYVTVFLLLRIGLVAIRNGSMSDFQNRFDILIVSRYRC